MAKYTQAQIDEFRRQENIKKQQMASQAAASGNPIYSTTASGGNYTSNKNANSGKTSSGGGSGSGGYTYSQPNYQAQMDLINNIYAQQQAAAAEAERKKQEAAQAAYDRSMNALNNAYGSATTNAKNNYNSTLGQLQGNYDFNAQGVNQNADKAMQEAYINYMMSKRDLSQVMAAQGLSGGASESSLASLYNNYGSGRNAIDTQRNADLGTLANALQSDRASALQAYNSLIADLDAQKANQQMTLESNLANAIADAAAANYDTQFSLTDAYLQQMQDILANMPAVSSSYSAGNAGRSVNVSQPELEFVVANAGALEKANAQRQAEMQYAKDMLQSYTPYQSLEFLYNQFNR